MTAAIVTIVASILSLLAAYYLNIKVKDVMQWFQDNVNRASFEKDNSEASELAKKLKEANDKQKEQEGRG